MPAHDDVALLARAIDRGADPAAELRALARGATDSPFVRAAAELDQGASLDDALLQHRVFSRGYVAALASSTPTTAVTLAEAAGRSARYQRRLRSELLGTLGLLALVSVALVAAVHAIFPILAGWLGENGVDPGPLWWASVAGLQALASPLGVVLTVAALVAALVQVLRGKIPLPGSRAVSRAACCKALSALLQTGLPAQEALRQAGEIGGHPALEAALARAAQQIEGGVGPADALKTAGLVPDELSSLWDLGEQGSQPGTGLVEISEALGEILDAEAEARSSMLERTPSVVYAAAAGALVLWFALTAVWGWVEVLSWTA